MRVYGNASIWIEHKKLGTFTTWDYSMVNSGEAIVNDEGWDGVSRGVNSTTLDVNEIVPVGGDGADLDLAQQRGTVLKIALSPVNGKMHSLQMVLRTCNYKSDTGKRTLEGSFKFEGGPANMTG